MVDVQVLRKTRNLTLPALRAEAELHDLLVLKKRQPPVHRTGRAGSLECDLAPPGLGPTIHTY